MSVTKTIGALRAKDLYHHCDVNQFDFETTDDLEDLTEVLGQSRALESIRFGIGIVQDGYNLFVMGPSGTGKHTIIRQILARKAESEHDSSDWCYVNNFDNSHKPIALQMPRGQGVMLRQDMRRLVDDLRSVIPATFESDEYRSRTQELEEEFKEKEERALSEIQEQAGKEDIALIRTPNGFAFAPVRQGEVLTSEQFEKLEEKERKHVEEIIKELQEQLRKVILKIPQWRRESHDKLKSLNREIAATAVGPLFATVKEKYGALPAVVQYMGNVEDDVVENVEEFRSQEEGSKNVLGISVSQTSSSKQYQVNVLVDNSKTQGAPVIYEDHPTYQNLVGRVEHLALMGALVSDFTLIKAGALHMANNGYLMLDAYKILQHPFAWEGLKRALRSREIRIESLERMLSLVSTTAIEPEPVPLDIKVILIGDRMLYYLLYHYDPDFGELFKVAADFEEQIDRTPENNRIYARLIGTLARKEKLSPLDRHAVARVIEHSARLLGDAEKLSTHMRSIVDLLREANYWAVDEGFKAITANHIQRAIDAQIHRQDRLRERMQEAIHRGIILIDTDQRRAGQVNALSVIQLGNFAFAVPTRITAGVRLGEGEVIDIEREVELGGPLHSKGVMILAGFLGARFARHVPLSLSASLVFEQSYAEVEGDSASSAELYALLSALADVPVRQSIAVTGSVSQHGQVQAIGGVNEKIEGFFDVCARRGLTGDQGVLIPAANVKHLMLRKDVVEAAAAGRFHVYPVETIDQGIEVLTGKAAGERGPDGKFPQGSINQLVEAHLEELATLRQAYGEHGKDPAKDPAEQ